VEVLGFFPDPFFLSLARREKVPHLVKNPFPSVVIVWERILPASKRRSKRTFSPSEMNLTFSPPGEVIHKRPIAPSFLTSSRISLFFFFIAERFLIRRLEGVHFFGALMRVPSFGLCQFFVFRHTAVIYFEDFFPVRSREMMFPF